MSWMPDHPGGRIRCDHPGCHRTRRYYCTPQERDEWAEYPQYGFVRDLCPTHKPIEGEA